MTVGIYVEIENLDKVTANMNKVGGELPRYLQGARYEISDEILTTKGLRLYPPSTPANLPPIPYYVRGRGMQVSSSRNTMSSERLGTRWVTIPYGQTGMKIGNSTSYAPHVHGENQAAHMKRKGWRKLYETARGKTKVIGRIYNKWINSLLRKYNLL